MYALLAIPLKSFLQPFVIMAALPFAFVGAVAGHLVMPLIGVDAQFSVATAFGTVAATGLAINAALVLLHEVGYRVQAGDSMQDALVNAAVSRARPIFITTTTTFAGLLPLMLSRSVAAAPMVPMAIALAFGTLFATLATLLVTPAFWLFARDIAGGARRGGEVLAGTLSITAPRLTTLMTRFPYLRESLSSQAFKDLEIPDDIGLDPETERIAREGLVRLYYEREFDLEEIRNQLALLAEQAPLTDNLVAETRVWAEERTFQLGVHVSRGLISPVSAQRPLADIIDESLVTLLRAAARDITRHTDARLRATEQVGGLIALGAAGRREFSLGGRLDLMLLATSPQDDFHEQLQGRFMRLVRNLSPEAMLFEPAEPHSLPSTGVGLALSDLRSYFDGQPAPAQLRMLVHARAVETGDDFGEPFEAWRQETLCRSHDRDALVADLSAVREQVSGRHRSGDAWDLWHRPGGLVDVALLAEYLQLTGAAEVPGIVVRGLAATFRAAGQHGLIEAAAATDLAAAADLWQSLDGYFRVAASGDFDLGSASPDMRAAVAKVAGVQDFSEVPGRMSDSAERVARQFRRLTGLA